MPAGTTGGRLWISRRQCNCRRRRWSNAAGQA